MDVGPRLQAVQEAALVTEVGVIVAEATAPLQARLATAEATNISLNRALQGANAEVGRLNGEVADLKARIAELEKPKGFVLAAEAKPRPGEATTNAGYVAAFDRLNTATGGVFTAMHVFSGTTIPNTFGTGGTGGTLLARPDLLPVVNIKTPVASGERYQDMAGAVAGKYDAQFTRFLDSWHAARPTQRGWLTIDHEPENPDKNINAEQYRQAWARYARLFLAHPISGHVDFAACFMGWTFEAASGRNAKAWDPLPLLTPDERKRVLFAADIYSKAQDSADRNWARAAPFFDYARANGYRTAVYETAVNNDAKVSDAQVAALIVELGKRFKAETSLELVAYYEATGPAAGTNAWIDTPAEHAALATWA